MTSTFPFKINQTHVPSVSQSAVGVKRRLMSPFICHLPPVISIKMALLNSLHKECFWDMLQIFLPLPHILCFGNKKPLQVAQTSSENVEGRQRLKWTSLVRCQGKSANLSKISQKFGCWKPLTLRLANN